MDPQVLQFAQLISTGGGVVALTWVVLNLLGEKGVLAPRWTYDQEHQGRMDAERRADRTLDVAEAAMAAAEKQATRGRS